MPGVCLLAYKSSHLKCRFSSDTRRRRNADISGKITGQKTGPGAGVITGPNNRAAYLQPRAQPTEFATELMRARRMIFSSKKLGHRWHVRASSSPRMPPLYCAELSKGTFMPNVTPAPAPYTTVRYVDRVGPNFLFRGGATLTTDPVSKELVFDFKGLDDAMRNAPNLPTPIKLPASYYLVVMDLSKCRLNAGTAAVFPKQLGGCSRSNDYHP